MTELLIYPLLASFLSAVVVTFIGLPFIIRLCRYFDYFDLPIANPCRDSEVSSSCLQPWWDSS